MVRRTINQKQFPLEVIVALSRLHADKESTLTNRVPILNESSLAPKRRPHEWPIARTQVHEKAHTRAHNATLKKDYVMVSRIPTKSTFSRWMNSTRYRLLSSRGSGPHLWGGLATSTPTTASTCHGFASGSRSRKQGFLFRVLSIHLWFRTPPNCGWPLCSFGLCLGRAGAEQGMFSRTLSQEGLDKFLCPPTSDLIHRGPLLLPKYHMVVRYHFQKVWSLSKSKYFKRSRHKFRSNTSYVLGILEGHGPLHVGGRAG